MKSDADSEDVNTERKIKLMTSACVLHACLHALRQVENDPEADSFYTKLKEDVGACFLQDAGVHS